MSVLYSLIRPETRKAHRAKWFVYAGGHGQPLEKIPHTAQMRGSWPGWDVECSCGWASKTGGATKTSVENDLRDHRWSEQCKVDGPLEAKEA